MAELTFFRSSCLFVLILIDKANKFCIQHESYLTHILGITKAYCTLYNVSHGLLSMRTKWKMVWRGVYRFCVGFDLLLILTTYLQTPQLNIINSHSSLYIVRPLLSAVLGRTKFWSQKPRIIELWITRGPTVITSF